MDTKHCSNMSPKVRNSQNSPTNFFLQKYELLEILGKVSIFFNKLYNGIFSRVHKELFIKSKTKKMG